MKFQNNGHFRGYVFALLATILWSGNYVIARGLANQIPPITLAFFRWVIATLMLLPFAFQELKRDWKLFRENFWYLSKTGLLGITLLNTFVYIAGQYNEAIKLSIITATAPIFTLLLSLYFFKERISKSRVIGILISIAGILILISNGDLKAIYQSGFSLGDIWIILSSISFSGYSILVKGKPEEMGNRAFLFSIFTLGLLFLTPIYVYGVWLYKSWIFATQIIGYILYLSLGASICAFFAWNAAVKSIGPSNAAIIYYSLPIFGTIEAIIFLGEDLKLHHISSFLLIIAGIIIASHRNVKSIGATYIKYWH